MGAKRVEGLLIQRLEGELLVVSPSSQEAHALNETAAVVFDLCDGEMSSAAMAEEVARRTGLPADEGVVTLALADLAEAGLVVLDTPEAPAITRRTLMRRLALPAAALALLPIVETVLVPTRASGQSPPPTNTATRTRTRTPTRTRTRTRTRTPTRTRTRTVTQTRTLTRTRTLTQTRTLTRTPTQTEGNFAKAGAKVKKKKRLPTPKP